MPRVVISVNSSWNIVNFRGGLIRGLVKAGFQVVVLAPPDYPVERIISLGAVFRPIRIDSRGRNPLRDLMLYYRYRAILRGITRETGAPPDAFLAFTIKPNIYGSRAAHRLGIPVVNNVAGLGSLFIKRGLLQRLAVSMYRSSLRASARVFFQNTHDADLFLQRGVVREAQVGVLPGSGVDLSYFTPDWNGEDRAASPPGARRFVLVSRLLKDKGIAGFVEAARVLRRAYPDARFRIVGFGAGEGAGSVSQDDLASWVREGVVEYAGRADDVRPHLSWADCAVLPSAYPEGTPRSLLEAAAMALPVITTDTPGCRNACVDGVSGYLCAPFDAADLAAKMETILNASGEAHLRMGQAGRAHVESRYDERLVVNAYLKELEDI